MHMYMQKFGSLYFKLVVYQITTMISKRDAHIHNITFRTTLTTNTDVLYLLYAAIIIYGSTNTPEGGGG